jgi:succinate dehydrogenase/fumarate reductase-like Fe-S protein
MGQENAGITQQAQQMQQALQANNEALKVFLEENDLVMDWQEHLEKLNKEMENAVQEQSTTQVDAQEQTEDGKEVGE